MQGIQPRHFGLHLLRQPVSKRNRTGVLTERLVSSLMASVLTSSWCAALTDSRASAVRARAAQYCSAGVTGLAFAGELQATPPDHGVGALLGATLVACASIMVRLWGVPVVLVEMDGGGFRSLFMVRVGCRFVEAC